MSAIDLGALLSFAVLVVSWAILPVNGRASKPKTEERGAVSMTPIIES